MFLPTEPGVTYTIAFDSDPTTGGPLVSFTHDPATHMNLTYIYAPSNTSYSYSFTATGTLTQVNWQSEDVVQRDFYLDNVSITRDLGEEALYFLADIRSSQDYSPFGVTLEGRNFVLSGAEKSRYGFNGQEEDSEIKGSGNSYDFGERMLDARLGRFFSGDDYSSMFPSQSPYAFAANSPILCIDKEGNYPVATHYIMTYHIMRKLGYSKALSKKVAHLASVYADHPDWTFQNGAMALYNRMLMDQAGLDPDEMAYKPDIDYSNTKESQGDEKIVTVSIHAMRTYWEDITPEEASKRALYGGTFLENDGFYISIEGAFNVIDRLTKNRIEDLSDDDMKELGVALHTIQDAMVHQGARWVTDEHLDDAEELGNEYEHPDYGCTKGTNIRKASKLTVREIKKFRKAERQRRKEKNERPSF